MDNQRDIKTYQEILTRDEIIKAIKAMDLLDSIRIKQLKKIHEHRWYEESIKDPIHQFFSYNIVCLKESARLKFGKDWYKK